MAQHMEALAYAEAIRRSRARVKREIRAGERTVASAFDEECCQSMPVAALIMQRRAFGPVKANKLLHLAAVNPTRLVRELTARQRSLLTDIVGGAL